MRGSPTEHKWLWLGLLVMVLVTGLLAGRRPVKHDPVWELAQDIHSPGPLEGKLPAEDIFIYVHVAGQVREPGVYQLWPQARVIHAVEAAGGFGEAAHPDAVNLALGLTDGQRVYIPTRDELEMPSLGGRVDLNRADRTQLESLPGIGPALAAEIISYRTRHGPFGSIDELTRVSGIGTKTVDRLRERVGVN